MTHADNFANLFALIKTVEKLEKSYINSAVASDNYESACAELLTKIKTWRKQTNTLQKEFESKEKLEFQ